MCLAIPGRIIRLTTSPEGNPTAEVEYPGERRLVSLLFLPEARLGDSILVQAGYGLRVLTREQAAEVADALRETEALIERVPRGPEGSRP